MANEHAINALLSTPAHPYSGSKVKVPDSVVQPKSEMLKHFKKAGGWRYDDKVDAIRVLKASAIDMQRMRRSTSFARFEAKLRACGALAF